MRRAFPLQSWMLYCSSSQSRDISKPLQNPFQNTHFITSLLLLDLEWSLATRIQKILAGLPGYASLLNINHYSDTKNLWTRILMGSSILFLICKMKILDRFLESFSSGKVFTHFFFLILKSLGLLQQLGTILLSLLSCCPHLLAPLQKGRR